MKTELLIIKRNKDYVRIKDKEYSYCGLDKASVFTMDQIDNVNQHVKYLKDHGNNKISVRKLIITEMLFDEGLR